jgi:hypothetical protein
MFPVAILLLNPEALQSVLSVPSGPIRAEIVSGSKGGFNGISYSGSPPTCWISQEWEDSGGRKATRGIP